MRFNTFVYFKHIFNHMVCFHKIAHIFMFILLLDKTYIYIFVSEYTVDNEFTHKIWQCQRMICTIHSWISVEFHPLQSHSVIAQVPIKIIFTILRNPCKMYRLFFVDDIIQNHIIAKFRTVPFCYLNSLCSIKQYFADGQRECLPFVYIYFIEFIST